MAAPTGGGTPLSPLRFAAVLLSNASLRRGLPEAAIAACVRSVAGLDAMACRIHGQVRRATGQADVQQS